MENKKLFQRFIIVWLGQLVSNIGTGLTTFTLGVFVYKTTNSATSSAMIMFCSSVPTLILRPIGGVFADRFDRRLLMIIGDLGSAGGLGFIFICMLTGDVQMWQIYTGAIISSVFSAFHNPAYKASVTDFVPEEMYGQASGLMQLASTSQYLVSPSLAGILFSILDMKYVIMIDMSTFLVAVIAVFWIRKGQEEKLEKEKSAGMLSELKEGMQAITGNKAIVLLISITAVLCFYIGFLQTLIAPMMLNLTSPRNAGISQSVCAAGLLVSALLIGVVGIKKHVKSMIIFLAFIGLFYGLMGVSTNVFVITAFGFLFFFVLAFVQTSLEVLIRQNVDNEKQGRVWSLISVVTQIGYPIAYGLAGILADYVFNPMFIKGGLLENSVGKIIGTGQGRGIGFMFMIFGAMVIVLSFVTSRIKTIQDLEKPEKIVENLQVEC